MASSSSRGIHFGNHWHRPDAPPTPATAEELAQFKIDLNVQPAASDGPGPAAAGPDAAEIQENENEGPDAAGVQENENDEAQFPNDEINNELAEVQVDAEEVENGGGGGGVQVEVLEEQQLFEQKLTGRDINLIYRCCRIKRPEQLLNFLSDSERGILDTERYLLINYTDPMAVGGQIRLEKREGRSIYLDEGWIEILERNGFHSGDTLLGYGSREPYLLMRLEVERTAILQ